MKSEPCSPACPTEGTPWPCPVCSGVHRFPVAAWRKRLADPAYRARILDIARRDHEGDWTVHPTPTPSPALPIGNGSGCDYQTIVGHCQSRIVHCGLGRGEAEGVVDESECRSCIAAGENRPIRLGLLTPGFAIGGAERWMIQLIDATNSYPFRWVSVACPDEEPISGGDVRASIAARCPVTLGPDAVRELSRNVDILLLWGLPDWPAMLDPDAACRVVLIAHGHNDGDRRCNADAGHADALVAVARAAVASFPEEERPRVRVLYNAPYARPATVDREAIRTGWGIPDGGKVLGYLGRVAPEKNADALCRGVNALPGRWAAVAVGPNHQDAIAPRTVYPGPTDDPGSSLAAFDAMLLPSFAEGCSIALIEAWAAGVPVVATPVGLAIEHPEFVRPVPPNPDGPTIAAAVLADERDPEGTAARVANARAFAERELSPARFRDRWRGFLQPLHNGEIADPPTLDRLAFISTAQMTADAMRLMSSLPSDIDAICAIPRSGLLPGSVLAYGLNLPLHTVSRQSGVAAPGHGHRLDPGDEPRHVLVIDDTAATGNEMAACLPLVRERWPGAKVSTAVIYALPAIAPTLDHYAAVYPGGHFMEWNFANSFHAEVMAFDMDGLICLDCAPADDDDGPRYRRWIAAARPLHLPRRARVPLIVTARPEWVRDATMAWLDRHRVKVDHLVMRDWPIDPARDRAAQIAEWKAGHFRRSGLTIFAESEPAQAEIIAGLTDRLVLCPSLGRVLLGTARPAAVAIPA